MLLTCAPLVGKVYQAPAAIRRRAPDRCYHVRLDLCLRQHATVDAQIVKHPLVELRQRGIGSDVHGISASRDGRRERLRVDERAVDVGLDLRAIKGDGEIRPLIVWQCRAAIGDERSARRSHVKVGSVSSAQLQPILVVGRRHGRVPEFANDDGVAACERLRIDPHRQGEGIARDVGRSGVRNGDVVVHSVEARGLVVLAWHPGNTIHQGRRISLARGIVRSGSSALIERVGRNQSGYLRIGDRHRQGSGVASSCWTCHARARRSCGCRSAQLVVSQLTL